VPTKKNAYKYQQVTLASRLPLVYLGGASGSNVLSAPFLANVVRKIDPIR
jgi:hypothetical protein